MSKVILAVIFILLCGNGTIAQDAQLSELWLSYGVSNKVNKKWKISGNGQLRLSNSAEFSNVFVVQADARRKVTKVFSFNMQYRYAFVDGGRNAQRVAIDGRFKWRLPAEKLTLSYRSRLQLKRINYNGKIISALRNKVGVSYSISNKFSAYLDYENFVELVNIKSFLRLDAPSFNKNRFTLGGKLRNNAHTLKAFFRMETSPNVQDVIVHIWGVSISQKL